MIARTHDLAAITGLFGVILLLPTTPTVSLGTAVACLLANQLGGIAPDIDQPTAPFWRNLPVAGLFGKVTTKMLASLSPSRTRPMSASGKGCLAADRAWRYTSKACVAQLEREVLQSATAPVPGRMKRTV